MPAVASIHPSRCQAADVVALGREG